MSWHQTRQCGFRCGTTYYAPKPGEICVNGLNLLQRYNVGLFTREPIEKVRQTRGNPVDVVRGKSKPFARHHAIRYATLAVNPGSG